MSEMLTVLDLVRLLKISRDKVYRLKEKIPYSMVGGAIRFNPADVEAYLEKNRKCPAHGYIAGRTRPTSGPSMSRAVASSADRRTAEIMLQLERGSRRVN